MAMVAVALPAFSALGLPFLALWPSLAPNPQQAMGRQSGQVWEALQATLRRLLRPGGRAAGRSVESCLVR